MLYFIAFTMLIVLACVYYIIHLMDEVKRSMDERINHACLTIVKFEERLFELLEKRPIDSTSHFEELHSELKALSHSLSKIQKPKKPKK